MKDTLRKEIGRREVLGIVGAAGAGALWLSVPIAMSQDRRGGSDKASSRKPPHEVPDHPGNTVQSLDHVLLPSRSRIFEHKIEQAIQNGALDEVAQSAQRALATLDGMKKQTDPGFGPFLDAVRQISTDAVNARAWTSAQFATFLIEMSWAQLCGELMMRRNDGGGGRNGDYGTCYNNCKATMEQCEVERGQGKHCPRRDVLRDPACGSSCLFDWLACVAGCEPKPK